MAFAPGDPVVVIALKRRGQVIARQGACYRVAIGGLTITCREQELRADAPPRTRGRAVSRRKAATSAPGDADAQPRRPQSSIDLHGMTVVQARDALAAHIDAALRADHDLVEVVHGIGTGRVRVAVVEVLKQIPSVRRVQPHPTNRGVTLVHL